MSNNFKLYSQYYDLIYQDKDYKTEASYIHQLIQQHYQGASNLLELGSGTGKHAQFFSDLGYKVLGIEKSAEMVAVAEQKPNPNASFLTGDISKFKVSRQFEAAISLFHVISYLTDNESLINTFKNIQDHLQENGIFIFDVWHSSAVQHQVPEKREKILSNKEIEVIRKASPQIDTEKNIVKVVYDIDVKSKSNRETISLKEIHPMRHFSFPEIELLAYATGFEILHSEEFLSKNQPSQKTWGVCYVLKKIRNV